MGPILVVFTCETEVKCTASEPPPQSTTHLPLHQPKYMLGRPRKHHFSSYDIFGYQGKTIIKDKFGGEFWRER